MHQTIKYLNQTKQFEFGFDPPIFMGNGVLLECFEGCLASNSVIPGFNGLFVHGLVCREEQWVGFLSRLIASAQLDKNILEANTLSQQLNEFLLFAVAQSGELVNRARQD